MEERSTYGFGIRPDSDGYSRRLTPNLDSKTKSGIEVRKEKNALLLFVGSQQSYILPKVFEKKLHMLIRSQCADGVTLWVGTFVVTQS